MRFAAWFAFWTLVGIAFWAGVVWLIVKVVTG